MPKLEITVEQHIEQLMTNAAQQGEWTIGEHQDFLQSIGVAVKEALGVSKGFSMPRSAPTDPSFRFPFGVPCSTEVSVFEHAVDVDSDPEIPVNFQLISMAKKICSTCVVQKECLESAESPPVLLMGILGGKTREERRPQWEERLKERLVGFEAVYKQVGQKLFDLVQKSDNSSDLAKELAALQEMYFPPLAKELEAKHPKVLSESIRQILLDPRIVERADMLLTINARKVLTHWMAAIKEGQDPFDYASAESTINNISMAERNVRKVLIELHNKTFDYKHWLKTSYTSGVRRSVLVFLCHITKDIPDGSEADLTELAYQKLAALDDLPPQTGRGRRRDLTKIKDLTIDYYGFNAEALGVDELAARYNLVPTSVSKKIKQTLLPLRTLVADS